MKIADEDEEVVTLSLNDRVALLSNKIYSEMNFGISKIPSYAKP